MELTLEQMARFELDKPWNDLGSIASGNTDYDAAAVALSWSRAYGIAYGETPSIAAVHKEILRRVTA